MNVLKTAIPPLLYLAAVIWSLRPPPPTYVSGDRTVVEVSDGAGPALLHSPAPVYPADARRKGIEGTVRLRVNVREDGTTADVTALDGPAALRDAAVEAVRHWQFTPVAAETEIQVPFLLWAGPRTVEPAQPVKREPAYAGVGRHGTVRLVATVDERGRVESSRAISGPQRLRQAAETNLRRWSFRPELHDGRPARGTAVVEVVF